MSDIQLQAEGRAATRAKPAPSAGWRTLPLVGVAALAILALFARLMTFELQRDEQFYISASVLFSPQSLYQQLNFSHLPNLPILLHGVFSVTGVDHYLLGGRLVIFATWLGSLAALWQFGRHYRLGIAVTALLMALLLFNPILLDAAGMAVTNNFIATPFLLFGLLAFLRGMEGDAPRPSLLLLAGLLLALGAGFKANYILMLVPVGLATLLMPAGAGLTSRLRNGLLPLVAGGLVGGLPTLYFFAQDPAGFIAHCFRFHRGPQIAYWLAHADVHDPKIMSLRDKLLMAHQVWLSGTTMLLPVMIAMLIAVAALSGPSRGFASLDRFRTGPIILLASIVLINAAGSFLPTPSFPQYHSTAFVFVILLIGLLFNALEPPVQGRTRPVMLAGLALATIAGGPILLLSLAKLPNPGNWTGLVVHEDARHLRTSIARAGASGPVATLLPVHALEGGFDVYPQLALGQFVYRASDYIPSDERRHFANLVSPATIGNLMAQDRPAAILLGEGSDLEGPLLHFALENGYRPERVKLRRSEDSDAPLLLVASRRP
jgi:hypothetical protein